MQQIYKRNNRLASFFALQKSWLNTLVLFVVLFISAGSLYAQFEDNSGKLLEYLTQEKSNLTLAISEMNIDQAPVDQADYHKKLQQNDAMLALNRAKIASFESFLVNQKKVQQDYSQKLKRLQQSTISSPLQESAQEKIEKVANLNEITKKTIDLINENLGLALRYQDLLVQQSHVLELWRSRAEMLKQLTSLHEQEDRLSASLKKLFENSLKLQQEIKAGGEFKSSYTIEARLLLNNQIISLTQYKMAELNLQRKLAKADYMLLKKPDIRTLQTVADIYKDSISQLSDMEQALKKMLQMLKNEQPHLTDNNIKQQFASLVRIVNARIAGIGIQEQTLQEDLENHQHELKKQLSTRQSLAEYKLDSWPSILQQFSRMPFQFYSYVKSLTLKTIDNYLWQDNLPAMLVWFALAVCLGIMLSLHKLLIKRLTLDKERSRLSGHLYDGALSLLNRNMPHLTITSLLLVALYLNQVPFVNYQLLFNLIVVWLTFRSMILIARLMLMERISDSSGKDVRLYYRIKWLLLAGGWTTALMVFAHLLPLPIILQDIFNRLFMLFLVAVSCVAWKSREVINHLLYPVLQNKKGYLRNAVMLLVVLTPVTLFTTAIIGLIGYINLAWTMSLYQVQILLIISGYVLMRGLLFDALELISEWMISSLKNGWLWIEVFLKPIDRILRLCLFVLSFYMLFQLFGWHSDSLVVTSLYQFGEYPLINISGIHITAVSILEFVIVASLFIWISRWTREFCYRWLYSDARDAGIRNSLSVFTQYAIILIGGFVALRVLGLDFSGMSMVVGGLAVGMGFGLRDFASNIIGGLMLLIERPVREGDLISLGGFEGKVSHIGIRSMRVSSWDNMEVLIPNAETLNKPFTNWTHQDGIVRTVFPIKVSRADDPAIVQQLIFDVLATTSEIVNEPPAQVFLKQIDDALIEFEVRYFIDVQIHTRFEVRSKVLFAIYEQFKMAGIKPPIPPFSVEINESKKETKKEAKNESAPASLTAPN
ncbi:mechanosensitive ion channel domain-containing protein [Legionella dresdenensis]|uniref:Mechanosensitive ion channel domain-containing protein n=1 Tax=Legionella dresdenensis TaxID=450200 RepID=A0ABV8CC79_9GAMM